MRKIYLMLASLALPLIGIAAESVPYASDMTTWEVINANDDSETWTKWASASDYAGTGWSQGIRYKYVSSNQADDWAISPPLTLEAGKEYKFKVWSKVYSKTNPENFAIYINKSNQIADLKEGTKLFGEENYTSTTAEKKESTFTPEEEGEYYIGAYCYSEKNKYYLYLTGFEVAEKDVFFPHFVNDLKVVEGANRAMEATLSWTLPTTDNDGTALPEDAEFNSIKIYRDGELVATLDGKATQWTDNAESGLTSGMHTYQVEIIINNSPSAKAIVESKYIGPLVAEIVPWEFDVIKALKTDVDFNLFFKVEKSSDSETSASQPFTFYTSTSSGTYINYAPSYNKKEDDWLFLPPVKFEEAGVYRFITNLAYSSSYQNQLDIWLCSDQNIASKIENLGSITEFTTNAADHFVAFKIEEPGEYNFAINANYTPTSSTAIKFYKFAVEDWHEAPAAATDLDTEVTEDGIIVKWTNPAKNNVDLDITALTKVEVYRDGEIVATLTENITPGEESTYTDNPENGGSYKYHVIPYIGETAAESTPMYAQSEWFGDKIQQLPYSYTFNSVIYNKLYQAIDLNEDGFTWNIPETGNITLDTDKITDEQITQQNDRILTPPFNFEKAGYYKISIKKRGGNVDKYLKIGLLKEDNTKGELSSEQHVALRRVNQVDTQPQVVYIKVEEAGRYCLGIDYDLESKNFSTDYTYDFAIWVAQLEIEYSPVLPTVVTDLAVTPGENYARTATLEWTNPSTSNIEGVAPNLVKAVVYRNDEQIAEVTDIVAGEKSYYEDNEVPGAGYHTYAIEIHGEDGPHAESAPSVKSPWIGAGMDIPYSQENFQDWTLINVDGDTNVHGDPLSWDHDGNDLKLFTSSKPANEWAISPRMNFEEGEYEISLTTYFKLGDTPITFDLYFGTGTEIDDMGVKVATLDCPDNSIKEIPHTIKIKAINPTDAAIMAEEGEEEIETPETPAVNVPAGVGTIGFHANVGGNTHVKDFSVAKVEPEEEDPDITVGVENVIAENGFAVDGDILFLPAYATDVVVADLSGRVLFSAKKAANVDLSNLEKGTYVATAIADGKKLTLKFTR